MEASEEVAAVSGKKRTNIWEHEGTLMEYWAKGMTGIATPDQKALRNECSLLTGLTSTQIKNWIGNHKKKINKKPVTASNVSYGERQKSGKDLFYSERLRELVHLPPDERMAVAAAEWRALRDTQQAAKYKENAKACPKLVDVSKDDDNAHSRLTNRLYTKLTKLITKMEEMGEEVVALSFNKRNGKYNRFGTEKGLGFARTRVDVGASFIGYVKDKDDDKVHTEVLRQQVVELFNRLYGAATGARHCSYKAVAENKMAVDGMPEGIDFCFPASYGRKKLKKILANSANIHFRRLPADDLTFATRNDQTVTDISSLDVATVPSEVSNGSQVLATMVGNVISDDLCNSVSAIIEPARDNSGDDQLELMVVMASDNLELDTTESIVDQGRIESVVTVTEQSSLVSPHDFEINLNGTGPKKRKNAVFTVEAIRAERKVGRRMEYLVKWKDYGESENSWEPTSSFVDSKIIKKWKQQKHGVSTC